MGTEPLSRQVGHQHTAPREQIVILNRQVLKLGEYGAVRRSQTWLAQATE
jgi:hypothetical protein